MGGSKPSPSPTATGDVTSINRSPPSRPATTPMVTPEFQGLRVTPNVYTTLDEIDFFADRMVEAVRKGV